MDCNCSECVEFEGPNPKLMTLRFIVIIAQMVVGLFGMVRERSWKALWAWLGGVALFWTVPRYLVCARCDGYGKNCYSMYLGRITSKYLPKVEGRERPGIAGILLEILALSTISNAPAVGMRRNRKLLAFYILLASLTLMAHFLHACRHCAEHGTDWRKECPSAKTYRRFFGSGENASL